MADVVSRRAPAWVRLATASSTTSVGSELVEEPVQHREVLLEPEGRRAHRARTCSSPASIQRCRSIPIERMLRTSWSGDSSKEKNSAFSPRAHAASAINAAMLVLPVPAVPLIITDEPR